MFCYETTYRLSNSNILSSFVSEISRFALSSLLSCFSALLSAFCNLQKKSDMEDYRLHAVTSPGRDPWRVGGEWVELGSGVRGLMRGGVMRWGNGVGKGWN